MEKKNYNRKILEIGLIILFAVQFLMLLYFNLKLNGRHMDFDSSWVYLKTVLAWKEKSLISPNWEETSNPFFDSSVPLASLLYGITGRLFASFGIVNMLIVCGIILCVISILRMLKANRIGILLTMNLIVCPYLTNNFSLTNELGYFNCVLAGPSHYGLRTLIVLLLIREFLYIQTKRKIDAWSIITLLLCFVSGMSSGIYLIVVILIPIFFYILERVLIKNDLKYLINKETIYSYICSLTIILGKLFSTNVLQVRIVDSEKNWTTIESFWQNIGAPFLGYLKLVEVLPVYYPFFSVFSKEGIFYIFSALIFLAFLVGFVYAITVLIKSIKDKTDLWESFLLFPNIIVVSYLMFAVLKIQYGEPFFEERYLIPSFFAVIILVGFFISKINYKFLISKSIILGLMLSLIMTDYVSDKHYIQCSVDYELMNYIKDLAEQNNVGLVYFWESEEFDEDVILCRNMRAYDPDRVYKYVFANGPGFFHCGDYRYYEDNSDYLGRTFLIIETDYENDIKENILEQYKMVARRDWITIYECDYNPIDNVAGITGDFSVDYPATPGMIVQNAVIEKNSAVSNGKEGFIMVGPYSQTEAGIYDFELEYSIIEGENAYFDVAIDNGSVELGKVDIDKDSGRALINDVSLEPGHTLEYRVYCEEGTIVKIDKVTIKKEN